MSDMKRLRFWGTSAGEGVPTPFCRCRVCEYARKHKGKDLRTRTGFRLNEKIMLDAGEDFVPQSIKYGEDTYDVEHILYSHTHSDHYNQELLWLRSVVQETAPAHKLHIYCSEDAALYIKESQKGYFDEARVQLHPLAFYHTYDIDGYRVTPLKGHHHTTREKHAANYVIEFPSGKNMYYALDSGIFLEETLAYLKNVKLDLFIGECTFPKENTGNTVHMDLTEAKNALDRLYAQGTITKDTLIYLTHICAYNMTHHELEEYWNHIPADYTVHIAYDGLSIDEEADMF